LGTSEDRFDDFTVSGDPCLPRIAEELRLLLAATQDAFATESLRLKSRALEELSSVLVDFAVDLHCGIGIWKAYERCNVGWFGAPLPLSAMTGDSGAPTGICPARIRHLLWVIYPALKDGLILSPRHQDLLRVAEAVHPFLNERFASVPKDSGIRKFLHAPNTYGWDIKRKLVWLGTRSYMFRLIYIRYIMEECGGRPDIDGTDEFVCTSCTRWSGLGAIDVLASILDITADDRRDLRSWYERHFAPYKVLSANKAVARVLNVVNNRGYLVRMNMDRVLFQKGQLVMGALVPWRKEWYWSGAQRTYDRPSPSAISDTKAHMMRTAPQIVSRYSDHYRQKAAEHLSAMHAASLAYHGNDLIIYPDGASLAADLQEEMRRFCESRPPEVRKAAAERHGPKDGVPKVSLPRDMMKSTDGIGLFLNPDEGQELMGGFNFVVDGFRRQGAGLTEHESEAVRAFIDSGSVSVRFVKRMVAEHGGESIKAAFYLPADSPAYWFDYLLRCHKGHFFRKRYPTIAVV